MRKSLIAITLLFAALCANAQSVSIHGVNYGISDGQNAIVLRSNGVQGSVVIPESVVIKGNRCTVTEIADSAFYDCYDLTDIQLPKSVNKIGDFAFFNTSIPHAIYSKEYFAYLPYDFKGKYELPKSITRICGGAFMACADLTELKLSKNVTEIGPMAFLASGLTKPVFTEKVFAFMPITFKGEYKIAEGTEEIVAGAFHGCDELTKISIPSSVRRIGDFAFYRCLGIDTVVLNDIDYLGKNAFEGCHNLMAVRINSLKVIPVFAFRDCAKLITFSFPDDLETISEGAFRNCSWLSPALDFSRLPKLSRIENEAFFGCVALQEVRFGNWVFDYVGDGAFDQCNDLNKVTLPKDFNWAGKRIFEHTKITGPIYAGSWFLRLPESFEGVYTLPASIKYVADQAFAFCYRLTKVEMDNSVQMMGTECFKK